MTASGNFRLGVLQDARDQLRHVERVASPVLLGNRNGLVGAVHHDLINRLWTKRFDRLLDDGCREHAHPVIERVQDLPRFRANRGYARPVARWRVGRSLADVLAIEANIPLPGVCQQDGSWVRPNFGSSVNGHDRFLVG